MKDISTVLNTTGDTTKLVTSFNALDMSQQKALLSSKLLTEEQKAQCLTMAALSSVNSKYTAEQLTRVAGVSAETLANWGLVESTDSLTIAELAELAVSDKQAKNVLDKIIAQNAQAVANGEVTASNIALASSEGGAALATGAFTTAIKANISAMWTWMTTTPLGWLTLLVAGVFATVKAYDTLTISIKEQKEKMDESLSAYEDAKSELSSITAELVNQETVMNELLAKEKLTYAEKGQLEELQEITKELRIQKDLAEKEEGRTEKQLAKDAVKLFEKQFGKYNISEQAIEEYERNAGITLNNNILSNENNISAMIAGYKQINELLDEAYGSGSQDDIDRFTSLIEYLEGSIFSSAQELQTQQDNISGYYNSIKDTPYEKLTAEQKEIVDTYTAISKAIALIYQQLDPSSWNSMQVDSIFSTEGIEKTKDELIAMAKSGELTPETIKGYANLNKALGETTLSAEGLCEEIYAIAEAHGEASDLDVNTLWDFKETIENLDKAKEKLSVLDETYSKLFDDDKKTNIGYEDYSAIADAFSGVTGIEEYIARLQEAGNNTGQVTVVMEDLISAYLDHSKILENVTEDNKDLIITMLEEMGIANAEQIVLAQLSYETEILALKKEFATEKGKELTEATIEEINEFLNMSEASDIAKQSIAQLALESMDFANMDLSTDSKIDELINLANAAGASATAIAKAKQAMNLVNSFDSGDFKINGVGDLKKLEYAQQTYDSIINKMYDWDYESLNANDFKITNSSKYKPTYSPQTTPGTSSYDALEKANEAMKDSMETIDFFEERVKKLNNAIELLETNLENVTGSFAKNKLVDAQISINSEKINNYTDALAMYTQKANEALNKLPSDIAEKLKNGSVSIVDFIGEGNEEVTKAISEYTNWADKVADCKQELAGLKEAIRDLELQKFNNIMQDFTDQFDLRENSKDLIDKQIALFEEAGQLIGESFYSAQIDQTKKQLAILEEEKKKLAEQMTSAVNSGRVEVGTDEWLEMVNSLKDVEGSILDAKKALEEFDNALLELHTEVFNRIQEQFSNIDSELGNLRGLFDTEKVSDGYGNWNKEALVQLGLLTQQYELARYQVEQYDEEIELLNQQYAEGRWSATEYADRLAELSSAQWDAVNSAEDMKDAIMDLNETRVNESIETIEKEIEKYRELIDAQIEALRAAQDLQHYKDSIADKNKSITDLERQIAAMQNDTSASTVAKRKLLEEQLAEARKDLERTEYDRSIDEQEKALNKEFERYEVERNAEIEALRLSLEQKETLIYESFQRVKENATLIGEELEAEADKQGIAISNAIITAWKKGEGAIASYGTALTSATSAFIAQIIGVENEVYALQYQANVTANSLAWMFATRADNLVGQLTASYYSEQNLNAMTLALRDSLINTLERGYNISSITSALDSVAKSASNATEKIKQMNKEMGNKFPQDTEDPEKKTGGHVPITGSTVKVAQYYASGTRNAKGGIAVTDEEGYEYKLAKLNNGKYTPLSEGSQVFTKEQTDKLYELSKSNISSITPIKTGIPGSVKPSNSSTIQVGNLINVEGSIDSTNIKQMESIANKAVDRLVDKMNAGIKYRNF